jgi:hypothetical protein
MISSRVFHFEAKCRGFEPRRRLGSGSHMPLNRETGCTLMRARSGRLLLAVVDDVLPVLLALPPRFYCTFCWASHTERLGQAVARVIDGRSRSYLRIPGEVGH